MCVFTFTSEHSSQKCEDKPVVKYKTLMVDCGEIAICIYIIYYIHITSNIHLDMSYVCVYICLLLNEVIQSQTGSRGKPITLPVFACWLKYRKRRRRLCKKAPYFIGTTKIIIMNVSLSSSYLS